MLSVIGGYVSKYYLHVFVSLMLGIETRGKKTNRGEGKSEIPRVVRGEKET